MTDFNTWSASALWTLLEVSAQATLCLAIILLLRRALGKQLRPDWSYALWGVLILRMLVPFSFSAPLLSYTAPAKAPQAAAPATLMPESSAITITSNPQNALPATDVALESPAVTIASDSANSGEAHLSANELSVKPIEATVTPPQVSEPRTLPIAAALFAVWLTGAIALLGTVVYRHFRLTRAIERDAVPASESISHVLRQVRDELHVTLWPLVLLTPSIATPTVIGILRPRILLPKALAEAASRDELRLILMHELVHVRRRDLWIAWLWLTALSLHWFNPLMWWAGARMRRDREQACDLRVLAALPEHDHAAYGHTLLKSLTAMSREKKFARLAGAAAIVEDQAELEGRLTMIKRYRPIRTRHRISGIVAALALVSVAFTQIWGIAETPPNRPPVVTKLMGWSVILKKSALQEKNRKYPALFPLYGSFAPTIDAPISQLIKDEGAQSLFHTNAEQRAVYFGYLIPNAEVAHAFLDAYEANDPAIAAHEDLKLEKITGGFDTIYALREGIERALITDINDPNAVGKAQSEVPTLWMLPKAGETSAYVLYLDGHVEKLEYPGAYPMDARVVERVQTIITIGGLAQKVAEEQKTLDRVVAQREAAQTKAPESNAPSPTPSADSNPFANITDEAKLAELRDEAAKAGDLIRACEAEMRRVKIRDAAKNPWKDKIDFAEAYRAMPPAANDEVLKARADAVDYFNNPTIAAITDTDYVWRIYHLMSLIARDRKNPQYATQALHYALLTYPRTRYADPAKNSKFQHLVNETAMLIWDTDGVDAAEKFVIDTWKKDRRFLYFFDLPWRERYAKEKLDSNRLTALSSQLGEKAPPIQITILVLPNGMTYAGKQATWDEIDLYLGRILDPANHFVALGYTSDEMSLKAWREAETRLKNIVESRGFDHFSDIGQQKSPLQQVTILISDGEWMYEGQKVTWQEIEKKLAAIPNPQDHFLAIGHVNGGFGLLAELEARMPYVENAQALVEKLGFDHVSLIGNQSAPANAPQAATAAAPADQAPQVDTSNPLDVAINGELRLHYAKASPEVQEFLRSTAKSFGRSGLWRPEIWDQDVDSDHATYLKKLFEEGTYGRHLCEGLAQASIVRNKNLVPGLIKVAAYHRDDQDYDCRPKWMAIAALARQEDESAVPTLVRLVDHGNLNTRMWAQAALARITDQSFGADKQAWANWWNAAGKTPTLGPDDVKPWTPPASVKVAQAQTTPTQNAPAQNAKPPVIVSTVPKIGDAAVPADTKELRVTFDQDMAGGFSWTGGGPAFSESAGKASWLDKRTCVFPVKLVPGKYYRLGINAPSYKNFQSATGTPVSPTSFWFVTAGTDGKPVADLQSPKIVALVPASDTHVSPETKEVLIRFDRKMRDSASFHIVNGKLSHGDPKWRDDGMTCVVEVGLVPDYEYEFMLNNAWDIGFQSAAGVPLTPIRYTFSTKAGDDKNDVPGVQEN